MINQVEKSISVRELRANIASVSAFKCDISSLSPRSTPRVLDDPIVGRIPSGSEDGVVSFGSAIGENSRFIELPVWGINANTCGLFRDILGECGASRRGPNWSDFVRSSVDLASSLSSNIGVLASGNESLGLDVLECLWWPSSVASLVAVWSRAINELLFW